MGREDVTKRWAFLHLDTCFTFLKLSFVIFLFGCVLHLGPRSLLAPLKSFGVYPFSLRESSLFLVIIHAATLTRSKTQPIGSNIPKGGKCAFGVLLAAAHTPRGREGGRLGYVYDNPSPRKYSQL